MRVPLRPIKNTKLAQQLPFKPDIPRFLFVIFLIFGTIGALTLLGTNAKLYSQPFSEVLSGLRNLGLSAGWSIVTLSLIVYGFLSLFLLVTIRDQCAAEARLAISKPEVAKLHEWGTKHVIYKSTYDQMVSRMNYYNKTRGSGSVIALMSIIQAPISMGLMYILRHDSDLKHATFLGIQLSDKILWMGIVVGFLYFSNSSISFWQNAKPSGKSLYIGLGTSVLVGLLMGFTVARTAFGVGLYFITGIAIVLVRTQVINWIRPKWSKRLESKVKLNYKAEDILEKFVDIDLDNEGYAIDADTGKRGKLKVRSSFR